MKAIVFDEFGSSSVLKIADLANPNVAQGEVLIRLSYTSVNPVDWKIRQGFLKDMFPHTFPIIPGWDASGEVIALGQGVSDFAIGDAVYAYSRLPIVNSGTYAELIALPADFVAKKPSILTAAEAAAVPLVGLTAYQSLKEVAQLQSGEHLLILGAAGGVGSFAVQFAKIFGAKVTATASKRNLDYVRSLGADHVIDYTEQNLIEQAETIAPQGFDVIFDAVGGSTLEEASALIKKIPGNAVDRIISIVDAPKNGHYHFVYPSGAALTEIAGLFTSGVLQMPPVEVRSILEAAAVQDESAKQRTRGKVVLAIDFN